MLLLLMRHGIAEPLSLDNLDDFHRALTKEGRNRTHQAALGLHDLMSRLDFLASSPKTRARQTAQIVRGVWGKKAPRVTEWSELMEDDFAPLLSKLRVLSAQTVLICGHEPLLGRTVSQFLTGSPTLLPVEFKKAGVCALEIEFEPRNATLLWHLTPKQLRKIGAS